MAEQTKQTVKAVETHGCTIRVRGQEITLDHAPTANDIEDLGFKHIGGKFHVYNGEGAMVRKSEFPYQGEVLDLREYHAPASQFFTSLDDEATMALLKDKKPGESASKRINFIVREHYKLNAPKK
jgi:hypothetical protein